jgi:hypothetical protein
MVQPKKPQSYLGLRKSLRPLSLPPSEETLLHANQSPGIVRTAAAAALVPRLTFSMAGVGRRRRQARRRMGCIICACVTHQNFGGEDRCTHDTTLPGMKERWCEGLPGVAQQSTSMSRWHGVSE